MLSFSGAIWVLFALAAVLGVLGLLFFLRPRWFLAWLKGTAALALLAAAFLLAGMAMDLRAYRDIADLQTVATLAIAREGPQQWRVELTRQDEEPRVYSLRGDQWQLEMRVLGFSGPLRWLGLEPAYRLERLTGRYLTLEQERSAERSVHGLSGEGGLDVWALDRQWGLPFVEAQFGSATFMPLREGAVYQVRLGNSGTIAVPVNEPAREAVRAWE